MGPMKSATRLTREEIMNHYAPLAEKGNIYATIRDSTADPLRHRLRMQALTLPCATGQTFWSERPSEGASQGGEVSSRGVLMGILLGIFVGFSMCVLVGSLVGVLVMVCCGILANSQKAPQVALGSFMGALCVCLPRVFAPYVLVVLEW